MSASNNPSSASGTTEDMYQIALLIDQLKHDDSSLRVNAANNLIRIATALGPERTREELIPFLSESTDDEDDVLRAITEQIGEMIPCVGGEQHIHVLLEPLELLSTVEESSVRNSAIKSIGKVVDALPAEHVETYFAPFVLKLATQEWFTSRISAACLFSVGYPRLPEKDKLAFKQAFIRLCGDDTPLVRRVIAQNIGDMALKLCGLTPTDVNVAAVSAQALNAEFLAAFEALCKDEQDSVRIQAISSAILLSRCLSMNERVVRLVPLVVATASDKSWRVRWSLASILHELIGVLGDGCVQRTIGQLAVVVENLLCDNEAEVRAAAASGISLLCKHLSKEIVLSRILPVLQRLVTDTSEHVRASLAHVINELAVVCGKHDTVDHLLPMLLLFLRDETSEVRLNIISTLETINSVVGVELLSNALLPAIEELAEDNNWRVRAAIIEHMPMIAQRMGAEFFSDKLNTLCLTWLSDSVFSVRKQAVEMLPHLCVLFGDEWTKEQIFPHLDRMHVNTNYLQRMTALYGVQTLCPSASVSVCENVLLPLVLEMSTDAVPNVRFTVARTLHIFVQSKKVTNSNMMDNITKVLNTLSEDTDKDVRYYAVTQTKAHQQVAAGNAGVVLM